VSTAIETHDIFRIYATEEGNAPALRGLSLTIREREVVVIFGPSGSGKTTLLRILAGLDSPSAGTVEVFGTDLRRLGRRGLRDYRSRTLGYADQHYTRALEPELSARELVALRLGLLGADRSERLRRADELLERVGLEEKRDARPGELSGGQQQRVALSAALSHRPKLFIADEPTGELDAINAQRIYDVIGDLARDAGATTVIVSHDPESASIADRVIHVRDGRVSAETARDSGHEEEIVVGHGGWIRLPEEFLRRAGIGTRAAAQLEERRIVVEATRWEELADDVRAERPVAGAGAVVAELRGVSHTYGTTPVFDGVNAHFESGKLTVVTGPSGSGKTTLLHLLAGLQLPTGGDVVLFGAAVSAVDADARAALRRSRIALVTQGTDLVPFLTARENVELSLALRGHCGDVAALTALGLAELADQRVSRLSTGERQRVSIARALAAQPQLLLADEPTARLDEANARAVGALFADLARETGAAIVCATHDPVLIEQADDELALGH
jgi:ABC-type lipoprotein export system ATPase subunit